MNCSSYYYNLLSTAPGVFVVNNKKVNYAMKIYFCLPKEASLLARTFFPLHYEKEQSPIAP